MKRTLPFLSSMLLALVSNITLQAQNPNLLDNPSFEQYSQCPNSLSDIPFAYWDQAPFHSGSTDFFHACATAAACDVPTNVFGTAFAAQGSGYVGGYLGLQSWNYREYLFDTLTQVLQAGQSYIVTFRYRLAPNSQYSSDNLGFYLSATPPTGTGTGPLGVTATSQTTPGNYINTNSQWLTYADTIIANGGEQYITIGSFNAAAVVQSFNPNASIGGAYCYYDTVEVFLAQGVGGDTTVCLGDSAQLYSYDLQDPYWVSASNPNVVIDTADTVYVQPTQTTTYWCIDAIGDTFDWTVQVIQPQYGFLGNDEVLCETDTIMRVLNNFPGYDFLWSDTETDSVFITQDSGMHWAEISIHGCVSKDSFHISYYPFPIFDLGNDTTICWYDTITLDPDVTATPNASNNVDYQWNVASNASSIEVNNPGIYWVDITNVYCTRRDSIEVSHYPTVVVDLGVDLEFCYSNSETITPNAQNAGSYQWSTGTSANQISVSTTGSYYVTATGNGCHAYDSVHYTFHHDPYFNLPETLMYCQGDSARVSTGLDPTGLSFLWNTGSTDSVLYVSGGSQGDYWVQVSDENCTMRDTIFIGMYPPIDLELGDDVKACEGEQYEIVPNTNPNFDYKWNGGATNFSLLVSQSGIYTLTVSDANCREVDNVRVIFFEYPDVDLGDDIVLCQEQQLTFDVRHQWSNVNYAWYDGTTTPMHIMYADEDQRIWVKLTNEVCSVSDSLSIDLVTPPFVRLPDDTIICENEVAMVTPEVNVPLKFQWSTGDTTKTLSAVEEGEYILTVDDGTCTSTDTVIVKSFTTPVVKIQAPEYICIGENKTLDATVEDAYHYTWQDGSTKPTLNIYDYGFYSVEVDHACGVSRDTVLVEDCECFMRFPSAFKPIPSGINRTFGAEIDCELYKYQLTIYDRWGKPIFSTEELSNRWDGTIKGKPAQIGSYAYICEYQALYDGKVVKRKVQGTVTVLR